MVSLRFKSLAGKKQVYLLTPMDSATTILHGPPSILQGNERQSTANCYADQEMSVITTYLNDTAQTPLNRFVV